MSEPNERPTELSWEDLWGSHPDHYKAVEGGVEASSLSVGDLPLPLTRSEIVAAMVHRPRLSGDITTVVGQDGDHAPRMPGPVNVNGTNRFGHPISSNVRIHNSWGPFCTWDINPLLLLFRTSGSIETYKGTVYILTSRWHQHDRVLFLRFDPTPQYVVFLRRGNEIYSSADATFVHLHREASALGWDAVAGAINDREIEIESELILEGSI